MVSLHHFRSTYCQRDITFDIDQGRGSVYWVPPSEVTLFFPFSYCTIWKKDIMHRLLLQSGELCSRSWGQSIYRNDLEFLCKRDMCLFLIYLTSHLFVSIWTHGYLLYTSGYNPVLLDLYCCSYCSSFGYWEPFSWLLCPFDISPSVYGLLFVCLFLSPFLLSCTTLYSGIILYTSCPSHRISHFSGGPGSFYQRMVLKIKIWVLGGFSALAVLPLCPLLSSINLLATTSIVLFLIIKKFPGKIRKQILCVKLM